MPHPPSLLLRTATGRLALAAAVCGLLAPASAGAAPAGPFRVSANGLSRDEALRDATQLIARRCAADGYVILADAIREADTPGLFYGAVTARCLPAAPFPSSPAIQPLAIAAR